METSCGSSVDSLQTSVNLGIDAFLNTNNAPSRDTSLASLLSKKPPTLYRLNFPGSDPFSMESTFDNKLLLLENKTAPLIYHLCSPSLSSVCGEISARISHFTVTQRADPIRPNLGKTRAHFDANARATSHTAYVIIKAGERESDGRDHKNRFLGA
jgi:hypothetical protein